MTGGEKETKNEEERMREEKKLEFKMAACSTECKGSGSNPNGDHVLHQAEWRIPNTDRACGRDKKNWKKSVTRYYAIKKIKQNYTRQINHAVKPHEFTTPEALAGEPTQKRLTRKLADREMQ